MLELKCAYIYGIFANLYFTLFTNISTKPMKYIYLDALFFKFHLNPLSFSDLSCYFSNKNISISSTNSLRIVFCISKISDWEYFISLFLIRPHTHDFEQQMGAMQSSKILKKFIIYLTTIIALRTCPFSSP